MEKKEILFDLDGTLTDPALGITKSVRHALRHFGIEVDDLSALYPFIGPPLKNSFMEFYGLSEKQAEEGIIQFRSYFAPHGIFENEVYDGIPELLKELRANGKRLFVVTSKPVDFAEQILEHFDLLQYFDFVAGATMSEDRVEKIDVMRYLLEEYRLTDLTKLVMVGDRRYDIEAARQLGISSVGVLFGYGSLQELTAAGADCLAKNVQELRAILIEGSDGRTAGTQKE